MPSAKPDIADLLAGLASPRRTDMTYLPCGCWLGAWNTLLPAPWCEAHKHGWPAPPSVPAYDHPDAENLRLRAEVERLTAALEVEREWQQAAAAAHVTERALADQLADDLTKCWAFAQEYARDGQPEPPSLAAWEAARHE